MKKFIVGGILFIASCLAVFAGDAAVLVDNGFSEDGRFYVFGQYGKTDKSFQGWAEIYTIDVEKNDYVDGEFYKIKPSAVTSEKTGKEVYESLAGQNYFNLKKYNCKPCSPDQILYIREVESKAATDEIVFKDFSSQLAKDQAYYHFQLVPKVSGTGLNVKSSFYIEMVKKDSKGNTLAKQIVGSPSINRKGVSGYKIERIVCDKNGKNLIFVIEKTNVDKTGINIRYMLEACKLNEDFHNKLAPAEDEVFPGVEAADKDAAVEVETNEASDNSVQNAK